jgi:hypothetical protein
MPGFFFQPQFRSVIRVAFLLWVAAIAGCGSEVVPATSTPAPSAGPALRHARLKGQSALEIWVDDVRGLYALDMEIHFDPTKLQVLDADPGAEGVQIRPGQAPAPDFVAVNGVDNQGGVIHYVVTQLGTREGFNGSGLVASVTWQGDLDDGAMSFGPVTLVDQDGQPIQVTLKQ